MTPEQTIYLTPYGQAVADMENLKEKLVAAEARATTTETSLSYWRLRAQDEFVRAEGLSNQRDAAEGRAERMAVAVRAYISAVLHSNDLAASAHTGRQMIRASSDEATAREALERLVASVEEGKVIHCESCGFEVKG